MTPVNEIMLVLFSHFILLVLADAYNDNSNGECPASFKCGYLHDISFPFTKTERQDCGLLPIQNCDADTYTPKMIQLQNTGKWFKVLRVGQSPPNFQFRDDTLYKNLESQSCEAFSNNYTLPTPTSFHFAAFRIKFTATLFRCNHTLHVPIPPNTTVYSPTKCPHYDLYYSPFFLSDDADAPYLKACTKVRLPIKDVPDAKDPFTFITADIYTEVKLTDECQICHYDQRGKCGLDGMDRFCCVNGILQKHNQPSCTAHALSLLSSPMSSYTELYSSTDVPSLTTTTIRKKRSSNAKLAIAEDGKNCPSSFTCGFLDEIKFPFTDTQHPHCGLLAISGCNGSDPYAPKSVQLSHSFNFYSLPFAIVLKD
ncbi:hypothetical protein RJT34_25512 [Clitoria ternatea]|uniref:Cyclotide n=1 Tax=Clitoria ternatea TaxID=43366 RepID=A0AAN9IGX6_CLITE